MHTTPIRTARIPTRRAFIGACLAAPLISWAEPRQVPLLMLANTYREDPGANLAEFWVSEKLDGVRAYWDGSGLLTRAGNAIAAPHWFTARLERIAPHIELDGELWGGRDAFERTSGIVRTAVPDDEAWRHLKYMVFDLPGEHVAFDDRLRRLGQITEHAQVDWVGAVPQTRIEDGQHLRAKLHEIERLGGEGLMLHRGASMYVAGRSDDLLKVKSFDDDEARVIGYVPGNGKYEGMTGALIVERADGTRFKIGSGLSDAERKMPPPVGAWVTYAYNGLTSSGLPRFPRYLRIRGNSREVIEFE
jgi:DNA ligase 1